MGTDQLTTCRSDLIFFRTHQYHRCQRSSNPRSASATSYPRIFSSFLRLSSPPSPFPPLLPTTPCPHLTRIHLPALTHAALGFLVEENQSRHVLEYYALDYAGSFLPEAPPPPPTPAPAPSTRGPTSAPTSSPTPQHSLAPSTPPTGGGNSSDTASPSPAPSSITTLPPTAVRTDAEVSRGHGGPREEGEEEQRGPVEGLNAAAFESEASFVGREERGVWDGMRGGNGTAELTWNNEANMRASSGFDEIVWASANYVGKITGLLYNDITGACETLHEFFLRNFFLVFTV